jgi:hypothetical protein
MGADGRRPASGGAMRSSGKTEGVWGVACSPHEEELVGVLGVGKATAGEVDTGGPRWVTTAASSVEDEFDPVNQNRCTNKLRT